MLWFTVVCSDVQSGARLICGAMQAVIIMHGQEGIKSRLGRQHVQAAQACGRALFLQTHGCYAALICCAPQARPSHTLIAADFDQLPEVAVAGVNAPLVATTVSWAHCWEVGSGREYGSCMPLTLSCPSWPPSFLPHNPEPPPHPCPPSH